MQFTDTLLCIISTMTNSELDFPDITFKFHIMSHSQIVTYKNVLCKICKYVYDLTQYKIPHSCLKWSISLTSSNRKLHPEFMWASCFMHYIKNNTSIYFSKTRYSTKF